MSHFVEELKRECVREDTLLKSGKTLEDRVKILEEGLRNTQSLLCRLVQHLEVKLHEDIDDDGHIGSRMA